MRECQGRCIEHKGEIKRVYVHDWHKDWGTFWYCENARQTDRDNGFTIGNAP